MSLSIEQHNIEIQANMKIWQKKSLLRKIYDGFHREIIKLINRDISGQVVEIGSGMGNFKKSYPDTIATDIFPNPWIDRVESAYGLSFPNESISNIVLLDVFHHLAHPGSALMEFQRVLNKGGRVILFEPYISLWGLVVFGIFHHEPVALFGEIEWFKNSIENLDKKYYAAEGNTTRIFSNISRFKKEINNDWNIIHKKKYSALAYILSGGFSKSAVYPERFLPVLKSLEKILDLFPLLFATRMMVVLEKR